MRKRRWKNQKKRQKNWFYKGFTSGFISLIKKTSERMPTSKL